MADPTPFFIGEKFNEFQQSGRFQSRHITPAPLSPPDTVTGPAELTYSVSGHLRTLSRSWEKPGRDNQQEKKWFGCYCIAVKTDDGMSWSAEAVAQRVAEKYPSFDIFPLAGRSGTGDSTPGSGVTRDSIPDISQVVGERSLMRAAVRHRLAKWYPTLYLHQAPLLLACLFLLGVVATIGQALVKIWSPSTPVQFSQLLHPALVIVAGALAILAVMSKWVGDLLATGRKEKSIEGFIGKLPQYENEESHAVVAYGKFVKDVAKLLQWADRPRIVIIDNYEGLDPTTRRVIESYFRSYAEGAEGAEFWVIFEREDGPRFSEIMRFEAGGYSYERTTFFEQDYLSAEARLKLNQFLGRDESPVYSAVKWIVYGTPQRNNRILSQLAEFREQHPFNEDHYGALEFLYFLSASAAPGRAELFRNKLSSLLSVKNLDRSEVLKQILKGTGLNKNEFREGIDEISHTFEELIDGQKQGADNVLTFSTEVARVFQDHAEKLQLPDIGVVNLYWALYWFDYSQKPDAHTLRKLTYHLLEAKLGGCPPALASALGPKMFDIALYAINGSLRTCLFRQLPKLVARAVDAFDSLEAQDARLRDRLLGSCWDVYSTLGDEEILAHILRVQESEAEQFPPPGTENQRDNLAELFTASAARDPESRELFRVAFQRWGKKESVAEASAKLNACAHASWLTSSLGDLASWIGIEGTLLSSVDSDRKALRDSFTNVSQKIVGDKSKIGQKVSDDKSALPMFTDVMTLSLCLWSTALLGLRLPYEGQVSDLLEMVDEALIVTTYLKDRSVGKDKSAGKDTEILLYALTRELCAVALGALLIVQKHSKAVAPFSEADSQKAAQQLQDGRSLFNFTLNSNGQDRNLASDEWIGEVDGFFKLAAFIWTRFDLDRLRDLAHLRRLQFNVICRELRPDDHTRMKPLVESASPRARKRAAYMDVLSNLVIAGCYRPSAELSADFALQAAYFAVKNNLGTALKNELAMVAINLGHALGYDLELFLRTLLDPCPDGRSPMRSFLGFVPTSDFTLYALRLLNASSNIDDSALAGSVLRQVEEVTRLLPPGAEKTEAETLLKLHAVEQRAKYDGGGSLAEELLGEWEDRKKTWFYPAVLDILMTKGIPTERAYREAYDVLQRDPLADDFNTFMNLAVDLAQHAVRTKPANNDQATLVNYMRGGMVKWEASRSAAGNILAYRLLFALDSSRQYVYAAKIDEWEKIKIEQDHTKRLRELAQREKYLLIFREYCGSAIYWGLQEDEGQERFIQYEKSGFVGRQELLRNWVTEDCVVPQPIVSLDPLVVSAKFLWIGQTLFAPPADKDSGYDKYRVWFDDAAKKNLTGLLDGILRLPHIPPDVRNLLSKYSAQFLEDTGLRTRAGGLPAYDPAS